MGCYDGGRDASAFFLYVKSVFKNALQIYLITFIAETASSRRGKYETFVYFYKQ